MRNKLILAIMVSAVIGLGMSSTTIAANSMGTGTSNTSNLACKNTSYVISGSGSLRNMGNGYVLSMPLKGTQSIVVFGSRASNKNIASYVNPSDYIKMSNNMGKANPNVAISVNMKDSPFSVKSISNDGKSITYNLSPLKGIQYRPINYNGNLVLYVSCPQ